MCDVPFIPFFPICFQCGTDQNPCHCKVVGPTLGKLVCLSTFRVGIGCTNVSLIRVLLLTLHRCFVGLLRFSVVVDARRLGESMLYIHSWM
ncbi:hypothetical protein N7507_010863 [Penicillium longicatenatum]|nr:hypothetical protein N7507_010863 [Penicillium longicatenatum]